MANTFTAGQAQCLIYTFKDGIMQKLAHDLKLSVGKLSVVVDGEQSVRGSFDASSVVTVCARKDGADDPGGVSDGDKKTIDDVVKTEILEIARHPEITFASTKVIRTDAGYAIDGDLTIKGKTRPLTVAVKRDGARFVGEVEFDQRLFDIKPYSAMLGTLRIQPVVKIHIEVPAT